MAKFCKNCGAQMDDNLMFCGNCGARADAQPAYNAAPAYNGPATRPFSNIDFKGILTGKTDAKTNWIVALALQALTLILFILPIFRTKVTVMGQKTKEASGLFGSIPEKMGLKGFAIVMFVIAILALVYMLIPILRKTELNATAALVMLVAQVQLYIGTIIFGIGAKDLVASSGIADMDLSSLYSLSGLSGLSGFGMDMTMEVKFGFSVGGWFYLVIGAVALFAIGRVVFDNRKKYI